MTRLVSFSDQEVRAGLRPAPTQAFSSVSGGLCHSRDTMPQLQEGHALSWPIALDRQDQLDRYFA